VSRFVHELDATEPDAGILRLFHETDRNRQRVIEQAGIGIEEEQVIGRTAGSPAVDVGPVASVLSVANYGQGKKQGFFQAITRPVPGRIVQDDHAL